MKPEDKKFHGKEIIDFDLAYKEIGTNNWYDLKGKAVAHFVKVWDRNLEEEKAVLTHWEGVEPFVRVCRVTGNDDLVTDDELCPAAVDEIEWILSSSLA